MAIGSHRFWRLANCTSAAGETVQYRTMATIEFRDSGGSAYTGVLADSTAADNAGTPANLVDGSASTYWRALGTNIAIAFDFGVPVSPGSIFFQAPAAGSGETLNRTINYCELEWSDDNIQWHPATTISLGTWGALGDTKTHSLTGVTGGSVYSTLAAPPVKRYWRMTNMGMRKTATSIRIAELKLYAGATQRTISSVTASDTNGTNVASNTIDGNTTTYWSTNTGGNQTAVTLDIDLGSAVSWSKLELTDSGALLPTFIDLYYSDDGSNWTFFTSIRLMNVITSGDVRNFTFGGGDGVREYTAVSGGPGAWRYWRMANMVASAGGANIGLTTVELRDASNAAITIVGGNSSTIVSSSNHTKLLWDGNEASEDWATAGNDYGAWLMFDLGTPKEVRQIYFKARSSGVYAQAPQSFDWEYSADGRTWYRWGQIRFAPCTANAQTRTADIPASTAVGGVEPPISAHRYWKFTNVRPQGGWGGYVGLSEVKFFNGASQLTVSAAAARDAYSGTAAANLIDGNNATVWATNTVSTEASPTWFSFDLGSAQTWDKIEFTARTGSVPAQWPWRARLQYSDDNSSWTDFRECDFTWINANNEVHDVTLNAQSGTPGTGPEAGAWNIAFDATDITRPAPTFSSPVVAQQIVFHTSGLTAQAPTFSSPAAHQAHDLNAADITRPAPTFSSPALSSGSTDTYTLNAADITRPAPTFSSPVLTQAHTLNAADVTAQAPTLGTPSCTNDTPLHAGGLSSQAPTFSSPVLAQEHTLNATDITRPTPTIGAAAVVQVHDLNATDITAQAPALSTPASAENLALLADDLAAGVPTFSSPTLAQAQAIHPTAITAQAPTLGSPALVQAQVATATAITAQAPTFSTPTMVVNVALVPDALTVDAPIVASAALTQQHALNADDIVGDPPAQTSPALAQVQVLHPGAITVTPVLDLGQLHQLHFLAADDPTAQAPTFSAAEVVIIRHTAFGDPITMPHARLGRPVLVLQELPDARSVAPFSGAREVNVSGSSRIISAGRPNDRTVSGGPQFRIVDA